MKRIHLILKMTAEDYDDLLLNMWLRWCHQKAASDCELQEMLYSFGIHQWFLNEIEHYEREFITSIVHYRKESPADLLKSFKACCEMVFSTWPNSAIKQLRKSLPGIKVPLLNYSQN